jgi:nicotinamide mononucleotide transporter
MFDWLNNNWIEVVGAILAFFYLLLEVKQKWTMWIACLISSFFYIYIFRDNHLYAMMGLYVYYAIMSIYGIYCWMFAKNKDNQAIDFHYISTGTWLKISAVALLIFGVMLFILWRIPDSPVPIAESLVAALSVIGTWMVARKIVECWYIWIFVNFFSIGLYVYQHLYPTAILFAAYGVLSIVGLIEWRKSVIKKT